jgi:hypothetical protein
VPLPDGWTEYSTAGFRVALPERWEVVDLDAEGIEAIIAVLENLGTEWAQNISSMMSAEAIQESMKLWAMDPEPAGIGLATINIQHQMQPITIEPELMLAQLEAAYEQMGIEMISGESGLDINGLEAIRAEIRASMEFMSVRQFQYVYAHGRDLWIVSLGVDEDVWEEYEPVFVQIAESFRVD